MKNYITINGKNFEQGKDIEFYSHVNSRNYHFPSLYKCYSSPSYKKVSIYENWFTWFETTKQGATWQYDQTFGVRSYNTNVFTLGITLMFEGTWYYLEIFPSRNIAHKLVQTFNGCTYRVQLIESLNSQRTVNQSKRKDMVETMARERQVTRTINTIEVTAICMDIETMETTEKVLSLTGDTPTNEQATKQLKKLYETDSFKVVAVKKIKVTEKLYGMSEIEFLKYAKELDTETRKPIENKQTFNLCTYMVHSIESLTLKEQ